MTIHMIPLSKLTPNADNPRKAFDETALAGLAQSIRQDGLLQNLVASAAKGRKRLHTLISGERRYRALQRLVVEGHLPADVPVPVEVREADSEADALRLAAIENIQREDLAPLEEAFALAALVEAGDGLAEIAAQTGLSERTIKRRLVLLELCEPVRRSLAEAEITLSQAEALSLGSHEAQERMLTRVLNGWPTDAEQIRDSLIGRAPSLSTAIFPVEAYQGTLTTDLFAEAETTYFDDREQFFELQKRAAKQLVEVYGKTRAFAVLVEGNFSSLAYREAEEGEDSGVIVRLYGSGEVELREGLVRREIAPSITAPSKAKPSYAKPLLEYVAHHKSAAVQVELIGTPLIAKQIGVASLLHRRSVHSCHAYLARCGEGEGYLQAMSAEAAALLDAMGVEAGEDCPFAQLMRLAHSKEEAFTLVQKLDEAGLDRLFAFLSLAAFGQENASRADTKETSLFNMVAGQLGTDMRKHWTPGTWFLSRRSLSQLLPVLTESGLSRFFGNGSGTKKTDLVRLMAEAFCEGARL